jgi:hypothetical protein
MPNFGIATAPMQVGYQDILRVWREADAIEEIEHAWLFDHLMPIGGDPNGPIFEGWTLLSALAASLLGREPCRGVHGHPAAVDFGRAVRLRRDLRAPDRSVR